MVYKKEQLEKRIDFLSAIISIGISVSGRTSDGSSTKLPYIELISKYKYLN